MSFKKKITKECRDDCSTGPRGPQGPPGTNGEQGTTGPPGPSSVVDVFFKGSNDDVQIGNDATLILPPITVSAGQRVELNAFAWAEFRSTANVDRYGASLSIAIQRGVSLVTQSEDGVNLISIPTNASGTIKCNPSVVWVDEPPAGTYVYILLISPTRLNVDDDVSFIKNRAITAKVYNAP